MAANLCANCQAMLKAINEEDPESKIGDDWNDSFGWVKVPQFQRLCHFTFSDISSAASSGCTLCSKLHAWSLKHGNEKSYHGLDFSAQPNVVPGVWKFRFDVSEGDGNSLVSPEATSRFTFTCHPLEKSSLQSSSATFDLYEGYKSGGDILNNTGNDKVLGRLNYWLQNCLKNHPSCSGDKDLDVYPPRLLDVSKPMVTLLADTSKIIGTPYSALSHSWGPDPQHLILTTENVTTLCECIPDDALHPTFRHAVDISRKLGIDYLWIDSLCIIQKNAQDWFEHLPIMGSIYQNCTINIAAAHGFDASAGCFSARNPIEIAPCVIELRKVTAIDNDDGKDPVIQREAVPSPHLLVPETLMAEGVDHFHLDTRGWVCQERLLSPRTVHFAKQLFWECSGSQNVCETIPEGVSNDILPKQDEFPFMGEAIGTGFSWGTMEFDEITTPYSWKAPKTEDQYEQWLKTLHGYVQRMLTKSSDKLPAIGGIAKRTATVLDDEYLAGLFRSRLPDALLWSCVQERRPKHGRSGDNFFAPSWSWAGINGDLDFTPLAESKSRELCTVVECHITFIDAENSFGQVSSAALTLRGPFLSFPRRLLDDPENWVYHFGNLHLQGFAGKKQLLYFDFDPSSLTCETLSLLVIRENSRPTTYPGSGDMEEAGLILAPDPSNPETQFIRVGVFKGIEYEEEDRKDKYLRCAEVTIV
jgi:hypothetical protein